jgi:thymidylate synthase
MAAALFTEATLDDLMRTVFEEILNNGDEIKPTKGAAREINCVLLELTNPLARLSRTETRGRPFSCLGELCWYLAKTNELGFISYYIPAYRRFADGEEIFGGYGPRLFDWDGLDQIGNVLDLLRNNPFSRKAVIQLFDAEDIVQEHKDVPCTCTLQLMIRRGHLLMFVNMRSNDAYLGLPHDVFCFTMLQEVMARTLNVEVGTYKHAVGSLHLYEPNVAAAEQFIGEGWQSTETLMPPMPFGDPWSAIDALVKVESDIRVSGRCEAAMLAKLNPYWADLARLLQIHRAKIDGDSETIRLARRDMSSGVYLPFIDRVLDRPR